MKLIKSAGGPKLNLNVLKRNSQLSLIETKIQDWGRHTFLGNTIKKGAVGQPKDTLQRKARNIK